MSEIVKTMKLHIHVNETEAKSLEELTACYAQACTFISKYVFDHGFILNFMKLQETLYQTIRTEFGLKSQFTISAFKTVTARYKTVQEQLFQKRENTFHQSDTGMASKANRVSPPSG